MSNIGDYTGARADLEWLWAHGAFAGVAEILRERRRQIEELGYDAAHDDGHGDGWLAHLAFNKLGDVTGSRYAGTADAGSDEDGLRKTGALAAAEMDRLARM